MIRPFAENDADKLMKIWLDASLAAHSFIPADYWYAQYSDVKTIYLPRSETFVYEEEGSIKGFISIFNGCYIGALFVDLKSQGKGIGKKLLRHVLGFYPELHLAVYSKNDKAVGFYQSNGFVIEKEQIDGKTGQPELILTSLSV